MKCSTDPTKLDRTDGVVLYVARRFMPVVLRLIALLAPELQQRLRPAVPLFSKPLLPGLGAADDPGTSESFGQVRSRLVADGIVDAWQQGRSSPQERYEAVLARFLRSGLSPIRPHLAPGLTDLYVLPQPVVAMPKKVLETPVASRAVLQRYLAVADSIGCRIVRDAVWAGDRCSWLVWTKEPINGAFVSVHKAAPADLYLGVSGIALFLACLTRHTDDRAQANALNGAVQQMRHKLGQARPGPFGFYTGSSGNAWALMTIGEIVGEESWTTEGLAALESIAETAETAGQFDLLSGQAGLILVLVMAARRHGASHLLDYARRLADQMIGAAVTSPEGLSWNAHAGETRGLVGLSHGTAGAGLALFELDRECPEPRHRRAAEEALRYERSLFDATHRNWPDFRTMPGMAMQQPGFPVAWCHGSTGVGVARLRLRELINDDARILPELDVALGNATTALNAPLQPLTSDLTLCHGVTGNSELLLMLGDQLGRADAVAAAYQVADTIIGSWPAARMPWVCGIPDCGESPSLMVGSAGIGLHFLRLYDRTRVPTILMPSLETTPRQAVQGQAAD
jgi:lantibiotic modifying enzyme